MSSLRLVLLVVVVLPAACVTPSLPEPADAPAWVRGPDSRFPEDLWLLARARAENADEAQDKARAELARPFVLRVESVSMAGPSGSGDGTRRLVALSDRIIEHIRVAARWQDPASKTHHALATLPRKVAAEGLKQAVTQRDEEIRRSIELAGGSGDLLGRIRHLDQALELQIEREALNRLHTSVSLQQSSIANGWSISRLREERDRLLARVRLIPQVTADSAPGLDVVLATVLSRTGLEAGQEGEGDYLLATRLVLEEALSSGETVRQQGVLEVTLIERTGQRIRRSQRWLIRADAPDRAGASRRALEEATTLLIRNLRRLLLEAGNY